MIEEYYDKKRHKKIIKKLKKMIKSIDRDYEKVYNIIINQIKGNATSPIRGKPQNEYSNSPRTKSRN